MSRPPPVSWANVFSREMTNAASARQTPVLDDRQISISICTASQKDFRCSGYVQMIHASIPSHAAICAIRSTLIRSVSICYGSPLDEVAAGFSVLLVSKCGSLYPYEPYSLVGPSPGANMNRCISHLVGGNANARSPKFRAMWKPKPVKALRARMYALM